MTETFTLSVTDAEKKYLHDLVRRRIGELLAGEDKAPPPPPAGGALHERLGAFVTLKRGGQLRGCIGNLTGAGALYLTVAEMAKAAAFNDPRFPPLGEREFADVEIEISIMGPITRCPDLNAVVVGRHGLIARKGGRQGLLLPQVPVEWGWDRESFIKQTCLKAGLPGDAWKDPQTEFYWFEAVVI